MEKYLEYFYAIAEIPHGSGNTKTLSDFLMRFAAAHRLEAKQDEAGNVVILKEAHPDLAGSAPVLLQGHIDMVAVKDADTSTDMDKEGLSLYEEGDLLMARGTSLGGDDGIAVAYMMDLLSGDYKTPPLECVFTVDEEIGMLGASALDVSDLSSRRMINIDQEEEGIFIAGCAGGVRLSVTFPVKKEVLTGRVYEISISGLKGGHSGIDIDKRRGNAIKALVDELCKLNEKIGFQLIEINGGYADNAIPREAVARIMSTNFDDPANEDEKILALDGKELFFGSPADVDEGKISVKKLSKDQMIVLDLLSTAEFLEFLTAIPDGVMGYDEADPSFVETSLNTGILFSDEDDLKLDILVRSSADRKKDALVYELCKLAKDAGASVSLSGDYPGWPFKKESPLRDKMCGIYEEMYGEKPVVEAIHAGLECGVFAKKLPGLDCVSIGPDIHDIHTFREALSLSSAKRTFDLIVRVLACL